MENTAIPSVSPRVTVPVVALSLYAVASGYLMSLIPLMLGEYNISADYASWLASVFYGGLLVGAIFFERIVRSVGHRKAFVGCLATFSLTIVALPLIPNGMVWLAARFIAGMAVAGVFVIVESWLMSGDESSRAKRLSLYMLSLYGGSALGQFGIGILGVSGGVPFVAITTLILMAILVLLFIDCEQPNSHESTALSFKQISKLSHAAIIGCIVSGLTLGAIYGLMPVELANRKISHQDIGTLMALVILGGMLVQPMVTTLNKYMARTVLMAFFCILGIFSIGLTFVSSSAVVLAAALFLLGMATFALYPIAINLGCEGLDERFIVSATQVMLFSYSVGSVAGPVVADKFMGQMHGLLGYLFAALLATCIYMLIAATKSKHQMAAGL
ncbi:MULTISPECIES: MFS transporter [Vibrio]|uniref:MFS transporter n=2 Tax=Vibrio campbellii TaxID=680 RepID=A0ACC7RG72_9VIBR|nr:MULTISPECIES: MFS transporter [Vibrio]EDL69816.1 permease [Vibrio campbellii HY01]APX08656.1 MFS transporter [Vibrio campbellii]ARR09136.1 MFS transporter [Vibrio campbellii]ARR46100.1 MFS transporter [Vibrio campbellii]AUV88588.1 MFS transporter [Vibrio campbellii]